MRYENNSDSMIIIFCQNFRNTAASQIMAKYGWKEGQGLGREEQGLSTCLQVEKTGKRAGKIINKDVQKQKQKDVFAAPTLPPPQFAPPPEFMTSPQQQPQIDSSPSSRQGESNITDLMRNPSKVVLLKVKHTKSIFFIVMDKVPN